MDKIASKLRELKSFKMSVVGAEVIVNELASYEECPDWAADSMPGKINSQE